MTFSSHDTVRELSLGAGCCAATKRGMEALLGQPGGVAAVLVVGGAPESLNSDKHKVQLRYESLLLVTYSKCEMRECVQGKVRGGLI